MNRAILCGRITRAVEIKTIPSGKAVANASLATNKKWKDESGQQKEKVEFHNLVLWGKSAEIFAQYVLKGHQVLVEGELETRSWEVEGVKKYKTEINVKDFTFLNNKTEAREGFPASPHDMNKNLPEEEITDCPF